MHQSCNGHDADPFNGRKAPAFTAEEHELIAQWADLVKGLDLRTDIKRDYTFLDEALHITKGSTGELRWLVHKTPEGAVAVRQWPGLAEIVPTIAEAFAIIAAAEGIKSA
jgi:hypothetical protein